MSYEVITYKGTIKALEKGTEAGILETCIRVTNQAVALAPVDKGQLKNSIVYATSLMSTSSGSGSIIEGEPDKGEGFVGSNLDYATYQEFGTRYMAPQPFLRPSIALVYGADKNDIINRIRKETERGPLKEGQKREDFK